MSSAAAILAGLLAAWQEGPGFARHWLDLAQPIRGLTTLDRDGDGRLELLVARDDGLEIVALESVRLASPAGGATRPIDRLARGGSHSLAWCVAPQRDEGGHAGGRTHDAVWTVRDDGQVERWELGAAPVVVVEQAGTALPSGVCWFPFARDLDGDGRADLALPEPSGLRLWFAGPDGAPRMGPLVRHRIDAELELPSPEDVTPGAAATLSIPSFACRDMNGDGRPDLAFEAEDRLQFFWSDASGALPETPTFDVDLEGLRRKLKGEDGGLLDPSNLFKALKNQVSADVEDLDGDGLADLLLRQGSKVSLFAGTRGGIDRARAAQVLKTSGNLLAAFPADDDGDGRLDLCMLQAADVSIGELLLWVVVGGKLELDFFSYFQQDERLHFAKSPSRRRRLLVDVPAILGLGDELDKNDTFKRLGEELRRLPVALDLDGDGKRDDVAALARDGTIELFEGVAPAELPTSAGSIWKSVVDRYDREAAGADSITIPLLGIVDWVPMPGGRLRDAIAGRVPSTRLGAPDPMAAPRATSGAATTGGEPPPATQRMLVVADLDGDRREDVLLVEPAAAPGLMRLEWFTSGTTTRAPPEPRKGAR